MLQLRCHNNEQMNLSSSPYRGPLVAFLDRAERHHRWVADHIGELEVPLLVCEPVLAEAIHLLARVSRAHDALFGLLENGALRIAFRVDDHVPALRRLHQKYRDRPMSLADACIVRMAEPHERHSPRRHKGGDARLRGLML
jgi:predicted nucleic acid-binding protein